MEVLNTKEEITANKNAIWDNYHKWYYVSEIWRTTKWRGVPCLKSVSDMWNYQEIINDIKPSLIIEFGANNGGATLFFHDLLVNMGGKRKLLSVDIDLSVCYKEVRTIKNIEFMECSSTDEAVAEKIKELRVQYPGPVFAILDSDHSKQHVLNEMLLLRPLLNGGDYLIVEDSNVGGHPVLPGAPWENNSPFDAREEYFKMYPDDYSHDSSREEKFGFTFSTKGFLIRNKGKGSIFNLFKK